MPTDPAKDHLTIFQMKQVVWVLALVLLTLKVLAAEQLKEVESRRLSSKLLQVSDAATNCHDNSTIFQ